MRHFNAWPQLLQKTQCPSPSDTYSGQETYSRHRRKTIWSRDNRGLRKSPWCFSWVLRSQKSVGLLSVSLIWHVSHTSFLCSSSPLANVSKPPSSTWDCPKAAHIFILHRISQTTRRAGFWPTDLAQVWASVEKGSEQGSNASEARDGKKVMKIDHGIGLYHFPGSLYMVSPLQNNQVLLQIHTHTKELWGCSLSSALLWSCWVEQCCNPAFADKHLWPDSFNPWKRNHQNPQLARVLQLDWQEK